MGLRRVFDGRFSLNDKDRSVARTCYYRQGEMRYWYCGDLQEAGTADNRRSRKYSGTQSAGVNPVTDQREASLGRAQQQLLMDGTAVESAFALLLTKVTKLAVSGTFI